MELPPSAFWGSWVNFMVTPQILGGPNSLLSRLCSGPTAPVWDYVTRHVRNQRNVKKIRGNLRWYPKFWGISKKSGGGSQKFGGSWRGKIGGDPKI
uniref:Uncharacterized protein n=1 Tax=Geospiza parvula TaxID=87175 RepID=A0A8U8BEZ5_GEOPR